MGFEVDTWIHIFVHSTVTPCAPRLKVQVGSGDISSCSGVANKLALTNPIPHLNQALFEMAIVLGFLVRISDKDISVTRTSNVGEVSCALYGSCIRRIDRCAYRTCDIHSRMSFVPTPLHRHPSLNGGGHGVFSYGGCGDM